MVIRGSDYSLYFYSDMRKLLFLVITITHLVIPGTAQRYTPNSMSSQDDFDYSRFINENPPHRFGPIRRPYTGNSRGQTLLDYLQPDDVDSGLYDDPRKLPGNSCTRPCGRESRTCYYRFTLEPYVSFARACGNCSTNFNDCNKKGCVVADGVERSILTINRRMPGPSIQVCAGDLIVVDVKNAMPGRSTTIHWHGMKMRNYKFMDGVPMVTQCPIVESTIFRYTFIADDPGLHFYHSHDGLQKVDGIVGGLMIRVPRADDVNSNLYDFDLPSHMIVVQDWHHLVADAMLPGLRYDRTDQRPLTYLINGRGQYLTRNGTKLTTTPFAEFNVTQGNRYVFRVIAGTCTECQYVLTIENHDMVIIAADAGSIKPYRVDSITMSPGERYSFVVNCNRTVNSYWIQVRTIGYCNATGAYQLAVLRYRGAGRTPTSTPPTYAVTASNRPGITMSPVNSACSNESRVREGPCISDLRSAYTAPSVIRRTQGITRIYWAFGFYIFEDEELYNSPEYDVFLVSPATNNSVGSTINGIVNVPAPSPLLSQYEEVPREVLCPKNGYDPNTWNLVHRECVHVIEVPAYEVIEIVIVDTLEYYPSALSHSIHLHGFDSYILEMGLLEQGVPFNQSFPRLKQYLDSNNRPRIPLDVVTKDTYPLPAGGYIVTRIYSDNPGFWFFHCHFAYHLDTGMSGILQVGEVDSFPPPPPGFPRCGDFLPYP
ncbi:laccase-3-like [Homalodisca vitripennis]|uniref:laccase-3-like n=1 Tax=Homalodisca vitripennis TaxID=197043 RepID=UPI001EEBD32B|nr:laccase-3-like [Homalodisca vitripennis]